jgi:integrase
MTRKAVRALAMILNVAMEQGKVAQNVAAPVKVEIRARDRKKIVIPPRAHLIALLDAADDLSTQDPRLGTLLRVALFGGLRSSELRGLRWLDVDLSDMTLSVWRRADRWNDMGAPKSSAGRRTIPIGPALCTALKVWKLRCPPTPGRLVFPNSRGKPMTQHKIIERFLAVQVAAGLAIESSKAELRTAAPTHRARYGLHSLRHAAASAWIKQGIDLKRLQVWLGHATIQLTIDTYGHLITDAQADAALAAGAEAALLSS